MGRYIYEIKNGFRPKAIYYKEDKKIKKYNIWNLNLLNGAHIK